MFTLIKLLVIFHFAVAPCRLLRQNARNASRGNADATVNCISGMRRWWLEEGRTSGDSMAKIDEKKSLSENLLDAGTYPGPMSELERARLMLQGCMTLGKHHAKAVRKIIFGISDSALLFEQASIKALTTLLQ